MEMSRAFPLSVRLSTLTLTFCLTSWAQSTQPPVIAKFIGVWMEDPAKLKIGDSLGSLRFQPGDGGGLEELRGAELTPLVQPVKFGAKAYAIDGSKNTIEWKRVDANHFERKIFHDGELQNTRRITLSSDGKTLTEITDTNLPSGKKSVGTVIFARTSGGPKGLAGTWKPQSVKTNTPSEMRFETAGAGVKVTNETGVTYTSKLDNAPEMLNGPTVITGTMIGLRAVDDHTLEATASRQGVVTGKTTLSVSNDGKTMTTTSTATGQNGNHDPSMRVYEKK